MSLHRVSVYDMCIRIFLNQLRLKNLKFHVTLLSLIIISIVIVAYLRSFNALRIKVYLQLTTTR